MVQAALGRIGEGNIFICMGVRNLSSVKCPCSVFSTEAVVAGEGCSKSICVTSSESILVTESVFSEAHVLGCLEFFL